MRLLALLLLFTFTNAATAQSRANGAAAAEDYAATFTNILDQVVTVDGLVRYDLLRGELDEPFRRVLRTIETFDPGTLRTDAEKMAFWINAYNVQMLQNILETEAVNDIFQDGFGEQYFKTPYRTAGLDLTLDDLENQILRKQVTDPELFDLQVHTLDPRLHVALNCAAVSCPRLRKTAFTPANLETELEQAMRDFVNNEKHFRVQEEAVVLSSLLDWFGSDFDSRQPAGDWILSYMAPSRPDYAVFKQVLAGKKSGQIKLGLAQPPSFTDAAGQQQKARIQFEYLWEVNRAHQP